MRKTVSAIIFAFLVSIPHVTQAHRSGCHNLHTCPSDSHSYVCGDLGYPCDGTTSINDIDVKKVNVPLLAEKTFLETFGRKPTVAESEYWKKRFRGDKESIYQIRRTMAWHAAHGSSGPAKPKTKHQPPSELVLKINSLFREVYDGRIPTVTENQYWISRTKDKTTVEALTGAMTWHKANGISH